MGPRKSFVIADFILSIICIIAVIGESHQLPTACSSGQYNNVTFEYNHNDKVINTKTVNGKSVDVIILPVNKMVPVDFMPSKNLAKLHQFPAIATSVTIFGPTHNQTVEILIVKKKQSAAAGDADEITTYKTRVYSNPSTDRIMYHGYDGRLVWSQLMGLELKKEVADTIYKGAPIFSSDKKNVISFVTTREEYTTEDGEVRVLFPLTGIKPRGYSSGQSLHESTGDIPQYDTQGKFSVYGRRMMPYRELKAYIETVVTPENIQNSRTKKHESAVFYGKNEVTLTTVQGDVEIARTRIGCKLINPSVQ
uniref:P26 n=1 Tax=Microplitis mediator TaxID=375433 RepID=A0A977KRL2_9HYME|nr:P26 [Microplitis mediator]